jgi:hypothetical protein
MEDRRTGLKDPYDKAGDIERARATVDVGFDEVGVELLEMRGELCAMLRGKLRATTTAHAIETLLVVRVDDAGRLLKTFLFDANEMDAARAQLEALAS